MDDPKERPILFSGAMVRAILSGQKTVTRRVVRLPRWAIPGTEDVDGGVMAVDTANGCNADLPCPYGAPGDRLWVRETWYDDAPGDNDPKKVDYRATHNCHAWEAGCACRGDGGGSLWRPSIHMPRWASRLTLAVTDVRVERLHAITPEDALREGVATVGRTTNLGPREDFRALWDMINGKRAPWASNPWVWRIGFARVTP